MCLRRPGMSDTWTAARMRAVFEKVKNWGGWGADDQLGALHLITPAKRREAAGCGSAGESVSSAREVRAEPSPETPNPALHLMIAAGDDCLLPGLQLETAMDFVGVAFHGMATSHIAALFHVLVN